MERSENNSNNNQHQINDVSADNIPFDDIFSLYDEFLPGGQKKQHNQLNCCVLKFNYNSDSNFNFFIN